MNLEEAIQQERFGSDREKAMLNILYTCSWINVKQVRFFKQYDISPQQYNVLRILRGQYPNPASVSLIQERMLDKTSNASRLVEKLKQRDLVKRSECSKDRRQVDVVIGPKGLELLATIDQQRDDIHDIMDALSEKEAKELNQLLDKLRINN